MTPCGGKIDGMKLVIILNAIAAFFVLTGFHGVFNYIAFSCMILSILTLFCVKHGRVYLDKSAVCFIFYMVFYVITSIPNGDLRYLATYAAYNVLSFSPLLFFGILKHYGSRKHIKFCTKLMYFIWLLIGVITIIYYYKNPLAAREAAAHLNTPDGAVFGGYFYAFGSAILCVYFFTILIKTDSRRQRIIILPVCIILACAVYLTQSTLTTIAMCVGFAVALLFRFKCKDRYHELRLLFRLSILVIVICVAYYELGNHIADIINWLSRRDGSLLEYRTSEVLAGVYLSQYSQHYLKRVNLIRDSFELFLKSPVIGHGYKYGNIFAQGTVLGIGNHSELMDALARYGLLGGIPLYGCYILGMKDYLKKYPGVLVTFALMFTVNPFASYQSHLAAFLLIPLTEEVICGGRHGKKP